jgi:hypothetical protein
MSFFQATNREPQTTRGRSLTVLSSLPIYPAQHPHSEQSDFTLTGSAISV